MENSKALYDKLIKEDLYSKSYDDFVNQYGNPEGQKKLYNALKEQDLYSKSEQDFVSQYWGQVKKKTRLKVWFQLHLRKLRNLLRFPKDK